MVGILLSTLGDLPEVWQILYGFEQTGVCATYAGGTSIYTCEACLPGLSWTMAANEDLSIPLSCRYITPYAGNGGVRATAWLIRRNGTSRAAQTW